MTNTYFLELFTLNDLTEVMNELFSENKHIVSIHYEENPNREHNSMMVQLSFTEEEDDDVEYFESVIDSIESKYYSLVEVYDAYEYYSTTMEW